MAITVRPATENDVTWIIHQLRDFSQFYGTNKQLFTSAEQIRAPFTNLIEKHIVLIAEDVQDVGADVLSAQAETVSPGRALMRLGFMAGTLAPHPFNPDIRVLTEIFWWTSNDKRNSRAGAKLLNTFIEIGKKTADWVALGISGPSRVNEKHLLKRGFHLQERIYLMEV